jgi:hypothetical protein
MDVFHGCDSEIPDKGSDPIPQSVLGVDRNVQSRIAHPMGRDVEVARFRESQRDSIL